MKKRGGEINKKGVAVEELLWWIIAIATLAVVVFGYIYLKHKGISAIEFIKNLFRFR